MKTATLRKLMRKWSNKASHCREESLMAWNAGLPANRLVGMAEGYEACVVDLLRTIKP